MTRECNPKALTVGERSMLEEAAAASAGAYVQGRNQIASRLQIAGLGRMASLRGNGTKFLINDNGRAAIGLAAKGVSERCAHAQAMTEGEGREPRLETPEDVAGPVCVRRGLPLAYGVEVVVADRAQIAAWCEAKTSRTHLGVGEAAEELLALAALLRGAT